MKSTVLGLQKSGLSLLIYKSLVQYSSGLIFFSYFLFFFVYLLEFSQCCNVSGALPLLTHSKTIANELALNNACILRYLNVLRSGSQSLKLGTPAPDQYRHFPNQIFYFMSYLWWSATIWAPWIKMSNIVNTEVRGR